MLKLFIPAALMMVLNFHASTFYVNSSNPNAKDMNTGTADSPWLNLQHGIDMAKPGDTVIVMPGRYERSIIKKSGTKDALITIKGSSVPARQHVDMVKLFDPLKPAANSGNPKENAVTKGFDLYGASFVRIENFEITDVKTGKAGVFLKKTDSVEIVKNFLHDLNPAKGNYGGIRSDSRDNKNTLVKDNFLFRCPGTSIIILGENWLVEGNEAGRGTNCNTETGENIGGEDAVRVFGTGHIIRYNFPVGCSHGKDIIAFLYVYRAIGSLKGPVLCRIIKGRLLWVQKLLERAPSSLFIH